MPETRTTPPTPPMKDEPELANEESVPSDGKDHKGERMMEELGRDKPGRPLESDHDDG